MKRKLNRVINKRNVVDLCKDIEKNEIIWYNYNGGEMVNRLDNVQNIIIIDRRTSWH